MNKTPQWEKEFEDMFPFELETNIAIREDIKGGYHERIDVRDDVKAFIKSTLEAERTRMIKALEGLKKELGRGVDELGRPESPAVIIQIAERRGFNSALDQAIKAVEKGKE